MNHIMKLTPDPFERIKCGVKVIEVRLFDDKRKKISLGDTITFLKRPSLDSSVITEVLGLSRFKDFKTLFLIFGTQPFGYPQDKSVEEVVLGMREAYSEKEEKQCGVLGIHIKVLDSTSA